MFKIGLGLLLLVSSGCAVCRRALDLDMPESGFKRLARSSIDQPVETWRNEESKVTCYRIYDEGLSCIKDSE